MSFGLVSFHTLWLEAYEALQNEKSKEVRVVFRIAVPPWSSLVHGYLVVKIFDPQDKFYSVKWYPTWDEHITMRTYWRTRKILEGDEKYRATERALTILKEFGGVFHTLFQPMADAPFEVVRKQSDKV